MDGQQRLTSLYQALRSGKPVDTMDARGKKLLRWYYLDIERSRTRRRQGRRHPFRAREPEAVRRSGRGPRT